MNVAAKQNANHLFDGQAPAFGFSGRLRSFLKGVSSVFDLSGQTFIEIPDLKTGFERDREAIAKDWQRIGGDMRLAVNQVMHGR